MEAERRFRPGATALWGATWAVGVTLGVALGGWLTVVGEAGAPGGAALDLSTDVIGLPLAAGASVFVVYFIGDWLVSRIRARRG